MVRIVLLLFVIFLCASSFAAGVTYCKHGSYVSPCNTMTVSDSDFSNNTFSDGSTVNDNISSLIVLSGTSAAICTNSNYGGTCAYIVGSTTSNTNIPWSFLDSLGMNDQISSIKVMTTMFPSNSSFGIPGNQDMAVMSIEDYSQAACASSGIWSDIQDIPLSHQNKDAFIASLQDNLDAGGYSTTTSYVYQDFEDSQATVSNWQSLEDLAEWVVFVGHGAGNLLPMYNCVNVGSSTHTFENYNKYLLVDSCNFLSSPISSYINMFGGLHAVFGFISSTQQFDIGSHESWDLEDGFMDRWIGSGYPLWEAWVESVELYIATYATLDHMETASVYPRIYIRLNNGTGRWLNANYEYFEDVFNAPLPPQTGEFHKVSVYWDLPLY